MVGMEEGAAAVHDGGVGQDPPRQQKQLAFKFAQEAWLEATHAVGGDAESKWKAMQPSEQRAIKAAAVAPAKEQENVAKAEAKAAKREAGCWPAQLYSAAHPSSPRASGRRCRRAGADAGGTMLFSFAIEGFLGWGFLGSVKRPYVQLSSPDRQKG
jgi:hypothetical protein